MGNCFGSANNFVRPVNTSSVPSTAKAISSTTITGRLSTLSSTIYEEPSGSGVSTDEAFPRSTLEVPNLRIYTLAELKSATMNFKPETVLGEGGFGTVFKGWVDEKTLTPAKSGLGMVVAVKKHKSESMQGLEQWQSEVDFLGRLSHPNLVKLLGYCREDRELLLVYEFMPKMSLDKHLFRRGSAFEPLSWIIRLKIAIGAARGLAFLHSFEKPIIYSDFKAYNILLDSNCNAKLCDFGLVKNGPSVSDSPVATRLEGTIGYMAPEYLATGHLYLKSDVYGFGVVLLEILSGQKAIDDLRGPLGQSYLVDWAKPFLADRSLLARLMDPGLEVQYSSKGAAQAAQLTLECLAGEPSSRPSMKEVVEILEEIEAMNCGSSKAKVASSHRKARGHNRAPVHRLSPLNARHEGQGAGAHAVYQSSKAR